MLFHDLPPSPQTEMTFLVSSTAKALLFIKDQKTCKKNQKTKKGSFVVRELLSQIRTASFY